MFHRTWLKERKFIYINNTLAKRQTLTFLLSITLNIISEGDSVPDFGIFFSQIYLQTSEHSLYTL